ncbi:hypothetical protein BANRA_00004 [Escherichia coli]|nr:hypothetical protein BANRA_00004 [Escherichia coli]
MDKLTTGVGTSAGNAGFWALQLLDKNSVTVAAIGVLGSWFWPADVSDKSLFQD